MAWGIALISLSGLDESSKVDTLKTFFKLETFMWVGWHGLRYCINKSLVGWMRIQQLTLYRHSLSLRHLCRKSNIISTGSTLWVRIRLRLGVLDITLCIKVCQWLAADQWFFPGILVSSSKKNDCHDITEILLKVALNIITLSIFVAVPNQFPGFSTAYVVVPLFVLSDLR